jgi:hypothetical protein
VSGWHDGATYPANETPTCNSPTSLSLSLRKLHLSISIRGRAPLQSSSQLQSLSLDTGRRPDRPLCCGRTPPSAGSSQIQPQAAEAVTTALSIQ